ncbi:pentatricopeptide repeat-containing protein, chloroplastic-like [Iris pallida]|uniref:Pentatricopeptide repeat-containing protein, chloroplastic-like n=1 Tax=Iris pallida TaxID=29817 RepID=A0AAX6DVH5_IRIPA|nr:pentatricopeptide repeat-containing protein, chloroplastic-like [Iris pallida]
MHISPTVLTANSVRSLLNSCNNNQHKLKQAHARILRSNPPPSLVQTTLSTLIITLSGSSRADVANLVYVRTLFSCLPNPTVYQYNPFLRTLSASGSPHETLSLFRSMLRSACSPNHLTFPSVIKSCSRCLATRTGASVHAHIVRAGLEHDPYVISTLVHFYATAAKDLGSARKVFDGCDGSDTVCWNAMIDGYVRFGEVGLARAVFDRMVCRDVVSWNTMVNGHALLGLLKEARGFFDRMPERNVVSWNSMLAGHAKCGDVEGAREIFREMPRRDVVSWNAMVACYVEGGRPDEAMALFEEMQRAGVRPTDATFVSLMSACARIGALEQGERLHKLIGVYGIEIGTVLGTALVDMYAKCGRLSRAFRIFDAMENKDPLSWNTIIAGMAVHGKAEEALRLFREMTESGNGPDDATFVAVLSACSYAGMVGEGRRLFGCMRAAYGVEPKVEHYGCVVDLLARKGMLEEAAEEVRAMPMEPNAAAWGALLGGCRIHGDAEIADGVGKRLLDLQPENSGRYVLLSNIYARRNRWEDASAVRRMMAGRGVSKAPGTSVIELEYQKNFQQRGVADTSGEGEAC